MPLTRSNILNYMPKAVVWLLALAMLGLIGFVDAVTGPDLNLALLYLVPLILVTWTLGRRHGLISTAACATTMFLADLSGAAPPFYSWVVPCFNALMCLAIFIGFTFLLSAWKEVGSRLEKTVDERTFALRVEVQQRKDAQSALHSLAAQLLAAEDSERRRVAYDIHDSISQMLTLLKLNIESIIADDANLSRPSPKLPGVVAIVDDLIRQTRTLTLSLHPGMLDDLGLVPTVRWYAEQLQQQTRSEVTVSEDGTPLPLPGSLAHFVYRAIKELLSNAIKHGKARELIVAMHWSPQGIRVVVDDNGGGFNPAAVLGSRSQVGLGLAGINERVVSLGGQLRVESEPDRGTRAVLDVPLLQPSVPAIAASVS